jgi:hypothetical protein
MEWTIPIQNIDVKNIRLGHITGKGYKQIAPISYEDGANRFTALTLLLPILPIKDYNPETGQLSLNIERDAKTFAKLQMLQEYLVSYVIQFQDTLFSAAERKEAKEIRHGFQQFVDFDSLHLYCPVSISSLHTTNEIQLYKTAASAAAWERTPVTPDLFTPGALVRLAIRIHGLSFHKHPVTGMWTGKFRLQHRIVAMFC